MPKPQEILNRILARALGDPSKPAVTDPKILARIEYVSRCLSNRRRTIAHGLHAGKT